jgi:hypothetical protein
MPILIKLIKYPNENCLRISRIFFNQKIEVESLIEGEGLETRTSDQAECKDGN